MKKPLGTNARHLPRYHPDQHATRHEAVDDAVGLDLDTGPTTHTTTAGGDTRKLRGIPAIGYGVAGAIPGTAPHLASLDNHPPKRA
jgi:hypothetical protein